MLTKCCKDTLNINDVNTLYSLRVAKYNKNEFQNSQDLKEIAEGLVKFQFKVSFMKKSNSLWLCQFNSYKNWFFKADV